MRKRTYIIIVTIIVAAVLLIAIAVGAEEKPSNYFVLRFGQFAPTGDVEKGGYEPAENGELLLGHFFNPYLALEGGFAIMHSEGAESEPYSVIFDDRDLTIQGWMLNVRFIYPAGKAELYAGLGAGTWRVSNRVWTRGPGGDYEVNDRVAGYHILAGANYGFTPYWYLGLEAKQMTFLDFMDVDDIESRTMSLSIGLRF